MPISLSAAKIRPAIKPREIAMQQGASETSFLIHCLLIIVLLYAIYSDRHDFSFPACGFCCRTMASTVSAISRLRSASASLIAPTEPSRLCSLDGRRRKELLTARGCLVPADRES